ncbi:STAS domain-containing protein [Rhodococcus triatomae]
MTGEIDSAVLANFTSGLDRAIDEAVGTLLVDLSQVDFMSVSGARALVDAHRRAEQCGVAMLIASEGPSSRTLAVTGIDCVLRCYPTVRDALEARRTELSAHVDLDRSATFQTRSG